jgi:hypothetical protein
VQENNPAKKMERMAFIFLGIGFDLLKVLLLLKSDSMAIATTNQLPKDAAAILLRQFYQP